MPTSDKKQKADSLLKIMVGNIGADEQPPDCAALGKWLDNNECPAGALYDAARLMSRTINDGIERHLVAITAEGDTVWTGPGGEARTISMEDLVEVWTRIPASEQPDYPVKPVVQAWINRIREIKPDQRTTGIIPGTAKATDYGQLELELGRNDAGTQLGFIAHYAEQAGSRLPGMEPLEETMMISPMLLLYDAAHMPPEKGGHGAPLSMRIWTEATMSMRIGDRHAPGKMIIKARDMIDWLWPNGNFKPSRHLPAMNKALMDVNHAIIPWKQGYWAAVLVRNFPGTVDDPILLEISLPPGSGQGPLIHRDVLRQYGVTQAGLYRAYLSIAYIWDEHGTQQGKVIQATRPSVARDEEGYILDKNGRRVTGKNGRWVKAWNHPEAVPLGEREPNPATRVYPLIPERELATITHSGTRDRSTKPILKARRTLDRMAEDGAIMLQTGLKTSAGEPAVKILPPDGWGPNWNPPAEFLKKKKA